MALLSTITTEQSKETHRHARDSLAQAQRRKHGPTGVARRLMVGNYYGEQMYVVVWERERNRIVHVLWREVDLKR